MTKKEIKKQNGNKKTLIIMGTHPNGLKSFDWSRKDCEIWMFNEAPNYKDEKGEILYPKCDICFQLHHEAIWKNPKNRSDEEHFQWLSSGKTPTIYMQKKYPEVPKSEKYPLKEILSFLQDIKIFPKGEKKTFRFFSSSPDYAFALVAYFHKKGIHYDHIEIHGIELEMESEYRFQLTGFGFWIGYLTALGIKIDLYNSIFDSPMYGYEGDVAIEISQFEKRIAELTLELGGEKDQYNRNANNFMQSLSELRNSDISTKILKDLKSLIQKGENAGTLNGRIKENEFFLEKARLMKKITGVSVFSMGEIEGTRVTHNKQYFQIRQEALNLNTQINPILKKVILLKKRSQKRQRALDELGRKIAEFMNKNMLLFHISGAMKEDQYYIESIKLSYTISRKENSKWQSNS